MLKRYHVFHVFSGLWELVEPEKYNVMCVKYVFCT